MKTLILRVPEPTNEAAVLVDKKLIELDSDLPLG